MSFQIVGGKRCNREPLAYYKRGSEDIFPMEIF